MKMNNIKDYYLITNVEKVTTTTTTTIIIMIIIIPVIKYWSHRAIQSALT